MSKNTQGTSSVSDDYTIVIDPNRTKFSKLSSGDIDNDIKKQSEEGYINIVHDIVNASIKQLNCQNDSKKKIRRILLIFFIILLSVQFASLFALLLIKGFIKDFGISDKVILTYITSVFVETLSAVVIMVKFSFESNQEIQALKILHGVIERYQKFGNNDSTNKD